jgi:hypothetical protein
MLVFKGFASNLSRTVGAAMILREAAGCESSVLFMDLGLLTKNGTITPMKKQRLILYIAMGLLIAVSGCTQVVTAPIKVAGAAASATLDVAGSAAGAVTHAVTGGD